MTWQDWSEMLHFNLLSLFWRYLHLGNSWCGLSWCGLRNNTNAPWDLVYLPAVPLFDPLKWAEYPAEQPSPLQGSTNSLLRWCLFFHTSISSNLQYLILGLPGLFCIVVALQNKKIVVLSCAMHGSVKHYIAYIDLSHMNLTVSEVVICAGRLPFSSWIADLIAFISYKQNNRMVCCS